MTRPTMVPGTIVIALGGNALQPPGERVTIYDQFRHTRESLAAVVELAREGWHIALVHGNGPQVGDALERNERARGWVEPLPLGVLVSATAGWIGYMVQQSLQNALQRAGVSRQVLTAITQTEVAEAGEQLEPTKPIGHALRDDELDRYRAAGIPVGRDGAGSWRRLAPSPTPVDVVESAAVQQLVGEGKIVVAGGGGGSPVYRHPTLGWEGVDAVVDKDRVAAILGQRLGADTLLILTNVDAVYADWGTPAQRPLRQLTASQAEQMIAGGGLGKGSMRPKVEAALTFVRAGGARAVIADLGDGPAALRGETGTTIRGEAT
ncbi:MAG: carbamate kinase [Gemmatimonadota bacterium]|nr:carbamate kinase [Gemmatimonadota bacterium]